MSIVLDGGAEGRPGFPAAESGASGGQRVVGGIGWSEGTMSRRDPWAAAVETFVRGYCLVRSETHPYLCRAEPGLYRLYDAERSNPARYRKEEFIAWGQPAEFVDAWARAQSRGWYFIGALQKLPPPQPEIRGAYRALGYRLLATQPFFVHDLQRIPRTAAGRATIARVVSREQAQAVGRAAGARPIPPAYFAPDSPVRQYAAMREGQPVGWVRSVTTPRGQWCTNLYVLPAARRQGIARALLLQMLRDDRRQGSSASVLLSSHDGAALYPTVGYRQIGLLWIFAPSRKQR